MKNLMARGAKESPDQGYVICWVHDGTRAQFSVFLAPATPGCGEKVKNREELNPPHRHTLLPSLSLPPHLP